MDFFEGLSSDGFRVVEAELGAETAAAWIARALEAGAQMLWLHTDVDLAGDGFERVPGYVRMSSEHPPSGDPLPRLAPEHYATTLDASYRGLWGHKLVLDDAKPSPEAVVLGLYDDRGAPAGLCTVYPTERLVDGPGVVPHARAAAAYRRLLLGACAELGDGPVELDSWGDSVEVIDAYRSVGFEIAEHVSGWQLRLG